MNISLTPALNPGIFTTCFVTNENFAEINRLLPAELPPLTEADADKDARNLYLTGPRDFLFLGCGPAAKFTPERLRQAIHAAVGRANELKKKELQLVFLSSPGIAESEYMAIALGETPELSNYQFKKYQKDAKPRSLETVWVHTNLPGAAEAIAYGQITAQAACICRDLVNEPPNVINAVTLAQTAVDLGRQCGFSVTVFDKAKLEELGFGGLLAVNMGSMIPPTFSILEWKPANARNSQPIVLVGKGVTFDTGGLSLKPAEMMVGMKGDMAGAAAVICTLAAVSRNKLPFHVIGLVPSTDNRPGYNAYTPNDVIRMYSGSHIEVLNTDAEGRMILADALHWAKQYNPAIVIDLATLTGAAVIAVGDLATAMYSTADEALTRGLIEAGHKTYERLVHFPLWDEYADLLKSEIADMKNVGGRMAGSITAAKFLQHFTEGYGWVHLDIAGPAMLDSAQSYRPKGGTGMGVRLLTEFIRRFA